MADVSVVVSVYTWVLVYFVTYDPETCTSSSVFPSSNKELFIRVKTELERVYEQIDV
jgi:hypothetical protein